MLPLMLPPSHSTGWRPAGRCDGGGWHAAQQGRCAAHDQGEHWLVIMVLLASCAGVQAARQGRDAAHDRGVQPSRACAWMQGCAGEVRAGCHSGAHTAAWPPSAALPGVTMTDRAALATRLIWPQGGGVRMLMGNRRGTLLCLMLRTLTGLSCSMQGGGVRVNNEKVDDELHLLQESDLIDGRLVLIAAGKKNKMLVRVA